MAKSKNRPWTEEEIELLQEYYERGMTYEEISKRLNRTKKSINIKIYRLRNSKYQNSSNFKIKGKWSEEEVQLLQKYLEVGLTQEEIANKLNRTIPSVNGKIIVMKNKTTSVKRKEWTTKEQELLIHYYNEGMETKEIAEKLERSKDSISGKLFLLSHEDYNIHFHQNKNNKSKKYATNHCKRWTKEEELRLKEYVEKGYSREDIAKILGRTFISVETRIELLKEDKENG